MVVLGTSLDVIAEVAIDGTSIEGLLGTRTAQHEGLSDGALEEVLRTAAVRNKVLHALQTQIRQVVVRKLCAIAIVRRVRRLDLLRRSFQSW